MNIKPDVSELKTDLSGEIDIALGGTAVNADFNLSGLGTIHAFNLLTRETKVTISGDALVETTVENKLDVNISGKGEVHYKGTPDITQEITGNGRVISKNR